MADLLEKLWPAFVSEVTEQLDSVELLLAKKSSAEAIDINHLFRSFHTIKGNCSMIGFTAMEHIAHKSEDILAAVRSDAITMNDDVVDILLDAISRLKKQFHIAHDSRENPPQDEELLARLSAFSTAHEKSVDVAVDDENHHEHIQALVGVSRMAVPSLVLGLDENAKLEQVEAAVKMLVDKASEAGLPALTRSLAHYVAVLKSDFDDRHEQLLMVAAEAFDNIEYICAEYNVDLSLELGATLCRGKLSAKFSAQLQCLNELLQALSSITVESWSAEQFLQLVNNSTLLGCYCSLFRYGELNANWRYVRQLIIEVSRGYIIFDNAMIDAMQSIVSLAGNAEVSSEYQLQCRQSLTALQETTAKYNNERDEIVDIKQSIADKSSLCIESLVDLKIDVLTHITQSIDEGLLAIEVDIDFSHEEASEKILMAVKGLGELTHSRTMFHDFVNGVAQRTSFAVLMISSKPLEDIRRVLSAIDQGNNSYTILGFGDEAVDEETSPSIDADSDDDGEDATQELVTETAMSMSSLKVDGSAVDQIISDVGELITQHSRLDHLIAQEQFTRQLSVIKSALQTSNAHVDNEALQQAITKLEANYNELSSANENVQSTLGRVQSGVLDLRVVPIAYAFNRFHKYVRDVAKKLNKQIDFEVVGEQVKIDKGMIDILAEPLAHMVRNSIDHGIEKEEARNAAGKLPVGKLILKAEQHNSMVVITVADDGAGLNKDKILEKCIKQGVLEANVDYDDAFIYEQIFAPGLSTSDKLTETSGRGVGMDVVKSKVQAVGGSVTVQSVAGEGTTLQLRLPISAAIQSIILIESEGCVYGLPERFVTEVITVKKSDVNVMQEQSVMVLRDNIVPLFALNQMLSANASTLKNTADEFEVVVIANDRHCAGLVVDATQGRAEVLVRDAHASLRNMATVAAAAILGDGHVVIILDCEGLFNIALSDVQNIKGLREDALA